MSTVKRLALGAALVAALALPTVASAAAPATCHGKAITIYAVPGKVTHGTTGDDVILGTSYGDRIESGDGDDTICSLGWDDSVDAGYGNDWVNLGGGNDAAYGRAGADVLIGSTGDDWLNGGPGRDYCESWVGGHDTMLLCETAQSGEV